MILWVYSRGISVATRSDAVRRVMQCVAPQVLERLTDSFAVPAVARDCSQCDHPTEEPVQCHLQQENEMQCRRTPRRLPLLWPFPRIIDARVRSQVSPCEIYGGQCGTGEGSSHSTLVSPCQRLATNDPYAFIHQQRYMTLQMRASLNSTIEIFVGSRSCVSFLCVRSLICRC